MKRFRNVLESKFYGKFTTSGVNRVLQISEMKTELSRKRKKGRQNPDDFDKKFCFVTNVSERFLYNRKKQFSKCVTL